jgi:hypothetical protein
MMTTPRPHLAALPRSLYRADCVAKLSLRRLTIHDSAPRARLRSTGSAANALIDEAANLHLVRVVDITEVDNN